MLTERGLPPSKSRDKTRAALSILFLSDPPLVDSFFLWSKVVFLWRRHLSVGAFHLCLTFLVTFSPPPCRSADPRSRYRGGLFSSKRFSFSRETESFCFHFPYGREMGSVSASFHDRATFLFSLGRFLLASLFPNGLIPIRPLPENGRGGLFMSLTTSPARQHGRLLFWK